MQSNSKKIKEVAKKLVDIIPHDKHISISISYLNGRGAMIGVYGHGDNTEIEWQEYIHSHWDNKKIEDVIRKIEKHIKIEKYIGE